MQLETLAVTETKKISNISDIERTLRAVCINEDKSILSEALKHHFTAGGSRTRANLTYKFSKNFLISEENSLHLSCIPELLHNASLVHDDINDMDEYRRDSFSIWRKFGHDVAICCGDFLISAAYSSLGHLKTNKQGALAQKIHEHVANVINGQIDDITQDNKQSLDDVETYELIAKRKSGPLFAMCLTLPLIMTDRDVFIESATHGFNHFAIAYQIYDDINDIELDQAKLGVKSGVNITTVMAKNNYGSAISASAELALSHLEKAKKYSSTFPFASQHIFNKELNKMAQKIKAVSSN